MNCAREWGLDTIALPCYFRIFRTHPFQDKGESGTAPFHRQQAATAFKGLASLQVKSKHS